MSKKIVVVGSGFAGLSAASFLAKAGHSVTVLEKHSTPGGRARQLKAEGFTFDMGPSWYWMPDVFDRYFSCFGKKTSDFYSLKRLDPSYRVYWPDAPMDIPADLSHLKQLFESLEPGAGAQLDKFLEEAAFKYEVGIRKLVFKPGRSLLEFADADMIKGVFRLDVFTSMQKHVQKFFKHPKLRQLLEFPVLFLGALAKDTPALYSLMNYADMVGGTWYPHGGMYAIVDAMYKVALELGVDFRFEHDVQQIIIEKGTAKTVIAKYGNERVDFFADVVVGAADYHFIESELLAPEYRSYTETYWDKRQMAPSCLLYYVGLNKRLTNVLHHTLFFDTDFATHADEIYVSHEWPSDPAFYACVPSVSDTSVAPAGCENLFFLVPIAAGLKGDTPSVRDRYFDELITRFEKHTGENIRDSIIYQKSFATADFISEYNSYKGNAYGLANTLMQTAVLKPACKSKRVSNLYFTGQLTVPGPGVPPSLISGEVVAKEVIKYFL